MEQKKEKEQCGRPPIDEIRKLFEGTGYEVFTVIPEYYSSIGGFTGVIDIRIAPKEWLIDRGFSICLNCEKQVTALRR